MLAGLQAPHTKFIVCENGMVLSLKSFRDECGVMGERKVEKREFCQMLEVSDWGSEFSNLSPIGNYRLLVSVASPFSPSAF